MKLPFSWLSQYVDIDGITPHEYDAKMTMSGSKVEEVYDLGAGITGVVTGKILNVTPHPNSDHLMICSLEAGQDAPVQIVTGAPNITAQDIGRICPVALHKSTLPGDVTITSGTLRGEVSNGMMCSFQELGLTHGCVPYACENGILLLPEGTPVGVDIKTVLGLCDYVADFEITSNRSDCLSVIGLARETAATFERPLRLHTPVVKGCGDDIAHYITVAVKEPLLCPRYTARVVRNIKIEPSPAWMRERLHAAGIRPINNIVDITNYVMLEYGQPMHAFDYACLSDRKIVVRRPTPGETLDTLDGQTRVLTRSMLAICDGEKPVAVAGVMGGANSEITDATKTIVFESACFHGATVRLTAKALSMRTEASGRFEKGMNANGTLEAIMRACELIEELGAGEVVDGICDVIAADLTPQRVPFDAARINALLGTDLSADTQTRYLARLGFIVEGDSVIVPPYRVDIARLCDIAEEVARIFGYDNIPTTLFSGETVQGALTARQQFERSAGELCRATGFDEAMTHSFISPHMYDDIALPQGDIRRISTTILNPLGQDFSVMRTTTLPSMLEALAHNHAHRNAVAALYELGMIYEPTIHAGVVDSAVLPVEERVLTLGSYGSSTFFGLKGVIEALLDGLDIKNVSFVPECSNPSYHPGRCARVMAGDRTLGVFGVVYPTVAKSYGLDGLKGEVLTAELRMNALFDAAEPVKRYAPLPKFPASTRDIAVVVDNAVAAASLSACIERAAAPLLESVRIFDIYTGANIPEGKKSMAYALSLRADDRTLTDDECDEAMKKVVAALSQEFHALLRG